MGITRKKRVVLIVVGLLGISVAGAAGISRYVPLPDVFARAFMRGMFIYLQQRRVQLLYETDHKALLDACREVSKQKAAGKLKRQLYRVLSHPDREVAAFPKAIRDLRPNRIFVDYDGRVQLEMMGGLDSFGVNAYPEGYVKPPHAATFGDKMLIDGLWYYDDGYRGNPEEYEKCIEALRPSGK